MRGKNLISKNCFIKEWLYCSLLFVLVCALCGKKYIGYADDMVVRTTNDVITKEDILAAAETYSGETIEQILRARSQLIDDGVYYINNKYAGKYCRYSNNTLNVQSGLIASLSNTIRWNISSIGGDYLIQPVSDNTKYLAISSDGNRVEVINCSASALPSRAKWSISIASGGGCLIRNVSNSKYLSLSNSALSLMSSVGISGSVQYNSCVWRIAGMNYYGNTAASTMRELKSGYRVTCNNVDNGEVVNQSVVKNPSNALWSNKDDFIYTAGVNGRVDICDDTIMAVGIGFVSINVTHKVTGLTSSFSFTVYSGLYDIYIYASGISVENIGAGSITGHAWIRITSNSAHEITIGHFILPSDESVTIGRWGSQIDAQTDGGFLGLWYDRELFEYSLNGKYGTYTCSYEVTGRSGIEQVSELILSTYNGYDLLRNNCVHFAIRAWNLCVEQEKNIRTTINTPNALINEIENLDNHSTGTTHYVPSTLVCGFYNGLSYIEHTALNN